MTIEIQTEITHLQSLHSLPPPPCLLYMAQCHKSCGIWKGLATSHYYFHLFMLLQLASYRHHHLSSSWFTTRRMSLHSSQPKTLYCTSTRLKPTMAQSSMSKYVSKNQKDIGDSYSQTNEITLSGSHCIQQTKFEIRYFTTIQILSYYKRDGGSALQLLSQFLGGREGSCS